MQQSFDVKKITEAFEFDNIDKKNIVEIFCEAQKKKFDERSVFRTFEERQVSRSVVRMTVSEDEK